MSSLSAKLRAIGAKQGGRHVLPLLAIEVAKAAARRELRAKDAIDVYVDYYKAASHLETIDPYDNGVKANVSKLRQIIICADPELLDKVTRVYKRLALKSEARPLYQAMVDCCREQIRRERKLTNAEIAKLARR